MARTRVKAFYFPPPLSRHILSCLHLLSDNGCNYIPFFPPYTFINRALSMVCLLFSGDPVPHIVVYII